MNVLFESSETELYNQNPIRNGPHLSSVNGSEVPWNVPSESDNGRVNFTFSATQIFWTVMFTSTLSLACLGNIMVIWIILAHRRMRTVTNYFLLNLSVADLTMASLNGLPNFVYMMKQDWIFGHALCVTNNFVAILTVASCGFTMTAISIDRYMAIVRPLHPRMNKVAAWKAIGAIWLCSVVLASPSAVFSTTQTFTTTRTTRCFLLWPDGSAGESKLDFLYTFCLLVLIYVLPMVAMAVCYGKMSKALWGLQRIGEVTERQINAVISKRKVVRMFIVIVLLFAICWAPYHLYFIYTYFDADVQYKPWVASLYLSFYFLAMSTSMVNPIIYYLMNSKFRNYIQEIFGNFFCCSYRRNRHRRETIEEPQLVRPHNSHSYTRSRSGTGDDNAQQHRPKVGGNLVLQSHLHCHHNPMTNSHKHSGNTRGRNHIKQQGPQASRRAANQSRQEPKGKQICNTYC